MDDGAALVAQNRLLGELVGSADPATPVPTCPGWTLRQLLTHVGRGHRWAATIVRERADGPVDIRSVADGKPPPDLDDAVRWLTDSAVLLLDALTATGPDATVWTFTGPKPASWWVRRRMWEALVHRGDAALALGAPFDVDPELAVDGISEWLALLAARLPADPPLLAQGVTLHLHASDQGLGTSGEWMVRGEESGISWEHGHGKGNAAVRGRAADLLLAVLRRLPADDPRLDIVGDPTAWNSWYEQSRF